MDPKSSPPRIPRSAISFVRALAALEPTIASEIDGDPHCYFCTAHFPQKPEDHDADCLWLLARQYVADIP